MPDDLEEVMRKVLKVMREVICERVGPGFLSAVERVCGRGGREERREPDF